MNRSTTVHELSRLQVGIVGATLLASAVACLLASRLVWNWTPSLPLGLYWLSRGAKAAPGSLAAFPVPPHVRDLVRERRYLPPGAFLVKPVVATAGDVVCTGGGTVTVNGKPIGRVPTEDSAGRALPHYEGCGPLAGGELFVASHYEKSFDSRTFGPVLAEDIRGTVTPLWTY
jgi:conjugative transfer signal peptidase TraF